MLARVLSFPARVVSSHAISHNVSDTMSDKAEEGQDKRDDDDNSDNVKDAVHANILLSIAIAIVNTDRMLLFHQSMITPIVPSTLPTETCTI